MKLFTSQCVSKHSWDWEHLCGSMCICGCKKSLCTCLSGVFFYSRWLTACVSAAWEIMFLPVTFHKDRGGQNRTGSLSFPLSVSLAVHFLFWLSHEWKLTLILHCVSLIYTEVQYPCCSRKIQNQIFFALFFSLTLKRDQENNEYSEVTGLRHKTTRVAKKIVLFTSVPTLNRKT